MLQAIVKRVLHDIGVGVMYEKLAYKKIATNCLDAMIYEKEAKFNPDRRYIVFKNCVLDTITRNIYNFDMRFRTDLVLDFDYIPEKRSRLWDRVIRQTVPNEEMRTAFQSFCGAFLTNRREFSIEYVCYLIGRGRNGKSVVTGAIANTFGEGLISNYSPQELFRDADKKYNRAGLVGKVANFSDDVNSTDFAGGMFKQFVSGHRISARNPYGKPFDLTEIPFMCCCVNEMPPTSDNSLGHNRRTLPILCPNKISEKDADPGLAAKLAEEDARQGIFNWVLQGLWHLRENHGRIILGDSVRRLQQNIATLSSSVCSWMEDYGIKRPDEVGGDAEAKWIPFKDYMAMYNEWCRMMNETPKTSRAVAATFRDLNYPCVRKSSGYFFQSVVGWRSEDADTKDLDANKAPDNTPEDGKELEQMLTNKHPKLPY
jgi:phage/plasmid-associated DNA primase